MKKNYVVATALTMLAGSFLLASHASAAEEYDVKAFGPKSPIVWEKPTRVVFEHKTHTDDIGLECSACHGEIFAMQRGVAPRTGKLTMAALAEGQFCGACHDGETAFASDSNCAACHVPPEDTITWEEPTKVDFGHKAHVEDLGLECSACHNDIFAMQSGAATSSGTFTMAAFAEGKYCGACHDGDTAFASDTDCAVCHMLPEKDPMVWTKPVKAVVFYHKVHTEEYGLDCDSCHNEAFAMKIGVAENSSNFTMKALYDGQYCGKCHDGETAFASNTLCNTCHIGVKGYDRMMGTGAHAAPGKDTHGGH
jgi:c(7)-type cytochrome triheme protein